MYNIFKGHRSQNEQTTVVTERGNMSPKDNFLNCTYCIINFLQFIWRKQILQQDVTFTVDHNSLLFYVAQGQRKNVVVTSFQALK